MEDKDMPLLLEPFESKDIEWRIQRAGVVHNKAWGIVLAYVTNRAIQDRLDKVVGASKWKNKFETAPDGGVLCGISIKCGDEWVTKYDGAENTQVEAVKGGLSSAMKRAAVQWGIGRYLYKIEDNIVNMQEEKPQDMSGWYTYYNKDTKTKYYWQSPKLPKWALPGGDGDEN